MSANIYKQFNKDWKAIDKDLEKHFSKAQRRLLVARFFEMYILGALWGTERATELFRDNSVIINETLTKMEG